MQEMTHIDKRALVKISSVSMRQLQSKKDGAEKAKQKPFMEFNDMDMLVWYIHEQKHANKANDRSARTKQEYEKELRTFIGHILSHAAAIGIDIAEMREQSLFKSLESRHLRRYQEWLMNESPHVVKKGAYSPATISRKTTLLKSFFRYLYRVKYIEADIAEGLRIASVRKDDRPDRDLGPQDVAAILRGFQHINHPVMYATVLVLVTTGLRNEEFCKLKVKSLQKDRIHGGFYLDVIGKGNKRRQIPLKQKVYDSIRMYRYARGLPVLQESDTEAPLFTTNRGSAFTPSYLIAYMTRELKKIQPELEDIHLRLTPHVFRHAFAITSRLSRVDVYDIMRSLGHEKIETTMIYLEKVFMREKNAINQWSNNALDEFL